MVTFSGFNWLFFCYNSVKYEVNFVFFFCYY